MDDNDDCEDWSSIDEDAADDDKSLVVDDDDDDGETKIEEGVDKDGDASNVYVRSICCDESTLRPLI